MKKLLLIAYLIFVNISLKAQSHNIGLKYIGTPQSREFSDYGYEYKKNYGYSGVGILYDYYSISNFTIGAEATYNTFRDHSKIFEILDGRIVEDYQRKFEYVSVPVKIGYKYIIGGKFFIQPTTGLISSMLVKKVEAIRENKTYELTKKLYKRFDVLGLLDFLIGYNLTPNIALTGSYRYQFKLSNKENTTNFNSPISTNRSNFTVGLNFKLGNKK